MKLIITVLFFITSYFCHGQEWNRSDIDIYKTFDEFESILHIDNDTTYLINFWATWCSPCVAELPYIEALNITFKDKKYKNILVSLDFEKQIDSRLIPFLNSKKIKSDVVILLDGKSSKWIDRVDPKWSGAIPITIIYNKEKRLFLERQFHNEEELIELIQPFF
jgi:thiol-disulfide isomerase/thioredoxin